ncbi:Ig-like domain-containing protein [Haloferula sp. A504]|uniref:Ig-like domain-containing protein n=1 Tax=Haloferula sp. A504 TaxID=3373601 RepID=UPI0031C4129B|nr:Ig-like domain-containing protein [Verrucomicrobiaceae bacterium E54]
MDTHSRKLLRLSCLALVALATPAFAAPPTLTNVDDLGPVNEDTAIPITRALLESKSNVNDDTTPKGDIGFQLRSVASGTLRDGGGVVVATGTVLAGTTTWSWTPDSNENGIISAFSIRAIADGELSGSDELVRIEVTPVNDPPVLGGTLGEGGSAGASAGQPMLDTPTGAEGTPAVTVAVFDSITVSDVDHNKPDPEQIDVTVTIDEAILDHGTFASPGWFQSASGGNVIFTRLNRTPSQAEAALDDLTFTPNPNTRPVNLYDFVTSVTITDIAGAGPAGPVSGSLYVQSVNDPPKVAATLTQNSIPDSGTWKLFRLSVTDPDVDETFEVTVNETGTSRGTLVVPATPITGDAAAVAESIKDVEFQPNLQGAIVNATFDVSVVDVHPSGDKGAAQTDPVTLEIVFDNDAPQISGLPTGLIRITDDPSNDSIFPFANVTVSDADPGQELTVTITLDDIAKGSFTGDTAALMVNGVIQGTAGEITNLLADLGFQPNPDRQREGGSETVTITISIDDGTTVLTNSQTRIEVTSVDGSPNITWDGSVAFPVSTNPALIDPSTGPRPFDKIGITDNSEVDVTITLAERAKGEFDPATLGGFVDEDTLNPGEQPDPSDPRIYRFSGTPPDAQTAIRGIVFNPNPDYLFPPGQPGRTDFTISASDAVLNITTRVLPIVLISDSRNFMVTNVADDPTTEGSLRHALFHAKNNDVITFALPSYPAVIRLSALHGPLEMDRHLTLLGPGPDKLTISGDANANGNTDANDIQLMQVKATVRLKGLRLSSGFADLGGAVRVSRIDPATRPGELILEDCIISDCVAGRWGGAVDVQEGSVRAERVLFENNRLVVSSGQGGGAVSLWTDLVCVFENCTFSGNIQGAPTGYGGGAIYAESYTSTVPFRVSVTHSTFAANVDAAGNGSAIHSNAGNTDVLLTNSLFADGSDRNLQVAGAGEISSQGGNLSDDNTTTALIQGGDPGQNYFLKHSTDQRNAEPGLAPIATLEGPTRGYRLLPSSDGKDAATDGVSMLDQRGVLRQGDADVGAVDADSLGRIIVNEIFLSAADPTLEFIEFFNPRDQAAVDLAGFRIRVNGVVRYEFGGPPLVVQPGFGFILATSPTAVIAASASTPVLGASSLAPDLGLGLDQRGRVELLAPLPPSGSGPTHRVVESVQYVGVFVNQADPTGPPRNFDTDSITLAPQSQGAAFVPNSKIKGGPGGGVDLTKDGPVTSPGATATGTPFGEPNAYPFAVTDRIEINEDDVSLLDVLANDVDADGNDRLYIVDLDSGLTAVLSGENGSLPINLASSPPDAPVTVNPDPLASPLLGTSLEYDPRVAYNYLPAGARVTDTFAYSILDVGGGAITGYADGGAGKTLVTAPGHRLGAAGGMVEISGSDVPTYNNTFVATTVDADVFEIDVDYVVSQTSGTWESVVRSGTVGGYADDTVTPGPNTAVTITGHGLGTGGGTVWISGSDTLEYNGVFEASTLDDDTLSIDLPFITPTGAPGTWLIGSRMPSPRSTVVTTGTVGGFADDGGNTAVTITAHGIGSEGGEVTISGSSIAAYNGVFQASRIDDNTLSIGVPFAGAAATTGTWQIVFSPPSNRSQALVEVVVLGRNDPPQPLADSTGILTDEDTVLRLFADPVASVPVLDSDALYPLPRTAFTGGLLSNDSDPDTNDQPFTQLRLVGVCQAADITDFTGTPGESPVTVTSPGHGISDGETILISGYVGHPSYNAYHVVSVDPAFPDTFTIPVTFVDSEAPVAGPKALWTQLDDSNRFQTTSLRDAVVKLEIRADRTQTNVIFDSRSSPELNALADGESITDTFFYAVEDTSGAVSLAEVTVEVDGVNDDPVPTDDPPGLAVLLPFVPAGSTLPETAGNATVLYSLPAPAGPGTVNLTVRPEGAADSDFVVIPGVDWTHEDAALELPKSRFLDNDGEVDTNDELSLAIGPGQETSPLQAAIRLNGDASVLTYDPTGSPELQALAFKERRIDVVTVNVTDGIATVPTTFIVMVEGRNDTPVASPATYTVDEKTLLTVLPSGLIDNGVEIDQNGTLPDNRRFVRPQEDLATTVFGARVDYLLENRGGQISSMGGVTGDPGSTAIVSVGHGLQTGQEVVLPSSGPLTGQYLATRLDEDRFAIPVPFDPANAGLGGTWQALSSTFLYDPRASVFAGPSGAPNFTLQGLAADQSYVDTFDYTLLDGSHLFANDDIFRVEVDRSDIELRVLVNDTSLDGLATSRSIVAVGPPSAGGTVSLNGDESILYTPETGFVGDEFFTYTIEDDLGNRDTALVTARVTIDRLNGNLRANPDAFTVATTQSPLLDVLANDSIIPATGAPLSLDAITANPDQGGTAVVEAGQIRYTPSPAAVIFPYTETFSYRMSGGGSATGETTVTVLVVDRRETLNARADSFGVPAGSTSNTLNVLENDNVLPANGEDFEIISTQDGPSNGSVIIVNGDALSYSPDPGFLGDDSFTYTVADGYGGTKTAAVTVSVGYLVTNPDIFSIRFDETGPGPGDVVAELDVLANDNVLQGGTGGVTISGVSTTDPAAAALGTMDVASDDLSLEFDPAEGETGQADFTYQVVDSSGRTSSGLVTVVVISNGVRASSDYFTVQTDSSENQLNILQNDLRLSPLPGELSISSIGAGPDGPDQGGTIEIVDAPPGEKDYLVYTPAPGFSGTESFTYTATDGDDSDTARVSVRVTAGAMVAADDDFLVYEGSAANRLPVLLNDRVIPDAGQLLFVTATGLDSGNAGNPVSRGMLEIIEDGAALSYTPSPDNSSLPSYVETFTYEISSGGTGRAEGTISIQVIDRVGVRDLETNDDRFDVRSDSTGTLLPVLVNDSVLPASPAGWTISGVSPAVVNVCSSFLFLPSDFADPLPFAATLTAQDTNLSGFLWSQFSPASQVLFGNPSADEAAIRQAMADEFNALLQGGASIHDATRFEGVTLRTSTQYLIDTGATGDEIVVLNRLLLEDGYTAGIARAPGGGSLQISGTDLIYVPVPGFVGSIRFTYFVSDGLGGTGEGEVIVKVGDVSVSDDAFTVLAEGGPVSLDVTANDGVLRAAFPAEPEPGQADFSLTSLQPVDVVPASAGTATVVDGKVEFTPDAGFIGFAHLTYRVADDGDCTYPGLAVVDVRSTLEDEDTASISVTVTGVNDEPMLIGADPSGVNDTMQGNPFANATVIEYDEQRLQQVTLTVTYDPARGTLVGGGTELSPGVLQFVGTAEEITAALRALVFTPTINRIPVGTTEDTLFSVSMDDGFVASPVIVDTAVTTVTPVNDPPVLTGTVGGQRLYQFTSIRPFSGVDINDVDDLELQAQTVTVQIDDPAKGGFSELGGFIETTPGTWVMGGTPAAVSSAIRALLFTPTPGDRITPESSETAQFTISVDDGFAPPVVDALTTVIILHGEVDRLLPLDPTGVDQSEFAAEFGESIGVSGDTLVVGSPLRDGAGTNEGRAYVYEENSGFGLPWGQVAELSALDAQSDDLFGEAVAIDGDVIVVGAPGEDAAGPGSGAVYVYERDAINPNAWSQVAKLLPPTVNAGGGDAFGAAVAIDGDTLLVGAPRANLPGAPRSGRAFVFRRQLGNWTAGETLVAADNRVNVFVLNDFERFGESLDIEGDTVVVGSPGANLDAGISGRNYGAAYVFTRDSFTDPFVELLRLDDFTGPDGSSFSGYGFSVSLSGDRLAIGIHAGTYSGDPADANFVAGGARIHERNEGGADQWGLVQKFSAFDGSSTLHFGHAVAISGDLFMVGSPGYTQPGRGEVDVFRFDAAASPSWNQIDRYVPNDISVSDRFGHAVALDDFTGVVGAIRDGENPSLVDSAGSASVYQFQYDLGPQLVMPLENLVANQDELFGFTLPGETFGDANYPDQLTLGVELSDGSPLPLDGWLAFDPATGSFSGTPTSTERRDYALVVYAVNPLGSRTNSAVFQIDVTAGPGLAGLYQVWAATQFPPAVLNDPAQESTVWGMDANPDGDKQSNIFDMLFGGSATMQDPPPMTFVKVDPSGGELTFPLSDSFPPAYMRVEWSLNLVDWFNTDVTYDFGPSVLGVRETVALVSPPGNPGRLFVRIVTVP